MSFSKEVLKITPIGKKLFNELKETNNINKELNLQNKNLKKQISNLTKKVNTLENEKKMLLKQLINLKEPDKLFE